MRILITGGSACGKSTFAEALTSRLPQPRCYLATMRPFGEESLEKISRHRVMRQEKGFYTVERYVDIAGAELEDGSTVLLECLCNLTANELFDESGAVDEGAFTRLLEGVISLESRCENLIVVTNDVGSGTTQSYNEQTREYVEVLGRLNAALAARFDVVYELVCGIPLCLKDELHMDNQQERFLNNLLASDAPVFSADKCCDVWYDNDSPLHSAPGAGTCCSPSLQPSSGDGGCVGSTDKCCLPSLQGELL